MFFHFFCFCVDCLLFRKLFVKLLLYLFFFYDIVKIFSFCTSISTFKWHSYCLCCLSGWLWRRLVYSCSHASCFKIGLLTKFYNLLTYLLVKLLSLRLPSFCRWKWEFFEYCQLFWSIWIWKSGTSACEIWHFSRYKLVIFDFFVNWFDSASFIGLKVELNEFLVLAYLRAIFMIFRLEKDIAWHWSCFKVRILGLLGQVRAGISFTCSFIRLKDETICFGGLW